MSYKIAICDDEKQTCAQLKDIIITCEFSQDLTFQVDLYYTAQDLLNALENNNTYDIYFLDIKLGDTNSGISIGEYIRNALRDETAFLVYVSNYEQYAMQLFKTRPFDFIVKPFNRKSIMYTLSKIFWLIEKNSNYFEFTFSQAIQQIPLYRIIYFRSHSRKILIHTVDEDFSYYDRLEHVMEHLPADQFVRIHKSYIVNKQFVSTYRYNSITTLQNETINISNPYKADVKHFFLKE